MKPIERLRLLSLLVLLGWCTGLMSPHPAEAQADLCCLPSGQQTFQVMEGTNSFAPVTFNSLPDGYSLSNGTYSGWCVQYPVLIDKGPLYRSLLYDSYDPTLPPHLLIEPWNKINYLLNHKQGMAEDIQNAIWFLLGQGYYTQSFTVAAQAMVDDANQSGAAFVPTNGQIRAVIVDPQENPPVQRVIAECLTTAGDTNLPNDTVFTSIIYTPQGHRQLTLTAQNGRCFVLETSTNLLTWTPLATLGNTTGIMIYTDTNAPISNVQFYRARRR